MPVFSKMGHVCKNFYQAIKMKNIQTYKTLQFPKNEPLIDFKNNHSLRKELEIELENYMKNTQKIPVVINGEQIFNEDKHEQVMPSLHGNVLATFCEASEDDINKAIKKSVHAQVEWANYSFEHRSKIFLKAAHLVRTKYKAKMLAATMLGQAKNMYQADIDCIAELIDFIEFNAYYAQNLNTYQDLHQPHGQINTIEYRPLEGFVAAIAPFNFTAIGGNLCTAPAMMGNVVMWKPSPNAMISSWLFYQILLESGLPENIIQFLPSTGQHFGHVCFKSKHLAAVNLTGSSQTFRNIWKNVSGNVDKYRTFPKMIGECGGKNFHFVHKSADIDHVVNSTIRSAFEYSGQKCSACSRIFLPKSQWEQYEKSFKDVLSTVKLGQPNEIDTFLSSVINQAAFNKISGYINEAKNDPSIELIFGGNCDDSKGFFIQPTVFKCNSLDAKIINEEIFGPVLSVYLYDDDNWKEMVHKINKISHYALTGSVFAHDRDVIVHVEKTLKFAAGNFYINDKSTGSVVAQQPFGGSRMSGTNDKAGMYSYVMKFTSARSVKENFVELKDYKYDYMK